MLEHWKKHSRIKITHRLSRDGFKGAALQNAISRLGDQTTHLLFFDADFLPGSDTLTDLLTGFHDNRVAAVQGHQSHSLNAGQNWVTKAVNAASAASCTTEPSAKSRLGSFIPLNGTVMMIRRDIIDVVGGFKAHTAEDFELTLRLYLAGYKVLYREDITVPAECPSRLVHVVRQNLRWSQGITSAFAQHLPRIIKTSQLSGREKLDLFLSGTYHLQTILFFAVNIIPLLSLIFLHSPSAQTILSTAPFALYLALAGPTSTAAGLYKDNNLHRSRWIPHSILLAYLVLPFQAYGALKGLASAKGQWHRTPKTGITTGSSQANAERSSTIVISTSPEKQF